MHREREAPTAWRIAWSALRAGPPAARRGVGIMAAALLLAIATQFELDFQRGEPLEVMELLSVLLGSVGAFLLGLVYLLHNVSQHSPSCEPRLLPNNVELTHINIVLVALPAFSFVSGVMLAAAIAILMIRVMLGSWVLIFPAAVYFVLLVLVARYVSRTTRFLYRHAHEQAEHAARAREEATESKLAALQAQMNPHFLFNSLNTVAALVRSNPRAAEHTVENLAAVLRRTLDRSSRAVSTLRDEVEFVRAYLAVEQERWRSRLAVEWNVDDALLDHAVPTMTLQPLVENALKYGIGTRLEGGRLSICASRENGKLLLTVGDDGPGFPPRYTERTGLGNLRRRLSSLYGPAGALEIGRNGKGAEVRIRVPISEH